MERGAAVIRASLALACLLFSATALAQDRVVLVASASSPLTALTSFEVRKLFLGIEVFRDGRMLRGLRNRSEERLNDVFLQSVVGLSETSYERRLLSNVFKFGTVRPDEFTDLVRLSEALQANPYAVTYLWIAGEPPADVKVLRVLWQEQ